MQHLNWLGWVTIGIAQFLLLHPLRLLLLQNEKHFQGPKHALKLMKLCTHAGSAENLHLIWVSEVGVIKGLNSATYTILTKCFTYTCTKFGRHMSCNTPIPTKTSPSTKYETQQQVCYLEFSQQVLCRFCHLFKQTPRDLNRSTPNLVSVI